MKKLSILIISLMLVTTYLEAQPGKIEPFADAIPYSLKAPTSLHLSNQDAEAVKAFFMKSGGPQPEKIERVDGGYYHGFRLCYNSAGCPDVDQPAQWVQVITINKEECIEWFEKNNQETLMLPFLGMKELTSNLNHQKSDFNNFFDQYKHLACRLYRQTDDQEGKPVNELALVIEKYSGKINLETNQMLASGAGGVVLKPGNSSENVWNLWKQCFEEIEVIGYITLIEYSDPPGSGSIW